MAMSFHAVKISPAFNEIYVGYRSLFRSYPHVRLPPYSPFKLYHSKMTAAPIFQGILLTLCTEYDISSKLSAQSVSRTPQQKSGCQWSMIQGEKFGDLNTTGHSRCSAYLHDTWSMCWL